MSEFVVFTGKGGRPRGTLENPLITVTERGLHLGAIVRHEYLGSADHVEFLIDAPRVGIRPVHEDAPPHAYSAKNNSIRAGTLWDELGVEIDESQQVPVDTESADFLVIDMAPFVDGGGPTVTDAERDAIPRHPKEGMGAPEYDIDDSETGVEPQVERRPESASIGEIFDRVADDEDENDGGFVCEGCGEPFDTEQGKVVHKRQWCNAAGNDRDENSTETPLTGERGELGMLSDVGTKTAERLRERGIETLADVRETPKGELLAITGVGETMAGRMLDEAGASPEVEAGAEAEAEVVDENKRVLDHERVASALEQVGVDPGITVQEFIDAVDLFNQPFQVSSKLDMTRQDADDLIGRLGLEDELRSDAGLVYERFKDGEPA